MIAHLTAWLLSIFLKHTVHHCQELVCDLSITKPVCHSQIWLVNMDTHKSNFMTLHLWTTNSLRTSKFAVGWSFKKFEKHGHSIPKPTPMSVQVYFASHVNSEDFLLKERWLFLLINSSSQLKISGHGGGVHSLIASELEYLRYWDRRLSQQHLLVNAHQNEI
jgi:hypothetical protein